jgi:hypothetical protein
VNRQEAERKRKKAADAEELATFFQRHARDTGCCLSVTGGPFGDFVMKPVYTEGIEEDGRWMRVDLSDKSVNAVRLDSMCGTSTIHKMLTQLKVPHEFDKDGTKELRITLRNARKLEEAVARLSQQVRQQDWKDRMEAATETKQSTSHSRS